MSLNSGFIIIWVGTFVFQPQTKKAGQGRLLG